MSSPQFNLTNRKNNMFRPKNSMFFRIFIIENLSEQRRSYTTASQSLGVFRRFLADGDLTELVLITLVRTSSPVDRRAATF